MKNVWKGIAPERWLLFLCERAHIDVQLTGAELSQEKIRQLARLLVNFTLTVSGTQSLDKAFVTGGGVSVKKSSQNNGLKEKEGLFFCGEILDIHGYTGGYNITSALVTGRIAGMHAAL